MRACLLALVILVASAQSQPLTADDILQRVDRNMASKTKIVKMKMIIHSRRNVRTIEARIYMQGTEKSYTEYLSPPREKGTKMLKLGKQLWIYSPDVDRTIKIAGHMLRQSVMGSDLSYEDMMEDQTLSGLYRAKIVAQDTIDNRPCWVLELTAKKKDVAYQTRKVWVDRNHFVLLKEQRFAKSGRLLKTTTVKEVKAIGKRWVPVKIVFKDELKKGAGTEFIIKSVRFDVAIPQYIFSKASLRK